MTYFNCRPQYIKFILLIILQRTDLMTEFFVLIIFSQNVGTHLIPSHSRLIEISNLSLFKKKYINFGDGYIIIVNNFTIVDNNILYNLKDWSFMITRDMANFALRFLSIRTANWYIKTMVKRLKIAIKIISATFWETRYLKKKSIIKVHEFKTEKKRIKSITFNFDGILNGSRKFLVPK